MGPRENAHNGDHEPPPEPRFLVAVFDVTGLNQDEVDQLSGEVHCQAESSDYDDEGRGGHPDVPVGMLDTALIGEEPVAPSEVAIVQTDPRLARLYGPDDLMFVVPARERVPS